MSKGTNLIFSYGTLPDIINVGVENLFPASLTAKLEMKSFGQYPMLVSCKEENTFVGVLMRMTDKEVKKADYYEGYPDLYTREVFTVKTEDQELNAWVYIKNEEKNEKK